MLFNILPQLIFIISNILISVTGIFYNSTMLSIYNKLIN
nr:MAG TPA: hypothetical protein [Caudoviricetes sp.]